MIYFVSKHIIRGGIIMKIIVLDGYTLNPGDLSWKPLQILGDVTIYDRTSKEQIVSRIDDAQVIFTNKTPITKEILDKVNNVKFIGVLATGYDVVDYKYAKKLGILVSNIPAYSTQSVSQMVFALLLEVCNQVGNHSNKVKNGKWAKSKDFSFWDYNLVELNNQTLGIIGFGKIGKNTAKIANAFGMNVIVYTRNIDKSLEHAMLKFVDIDELYKKSDVISLHCPLTDGNKQFINKNSISKMKDKVILINTARGGLINERDLKEALESKKIYYAAVDVLKQEPANIDNPLLNVENIFITPHIAWATKASRQRLLDSAVNNLKNYIKGTPINIVNM